MKTAGRQARQRETLSMNRNLKTSLILLLIVTGFAVYWDTQPHEFITFDDDIYITGNEMVRKGLTWNGFTWALTSVHKMYWHPVTWLSHMIDSEIYGLNSRGHHFNNLLLHIANAVLLFLAFYRMSRAPWRSFFVAALFLVHPLSVESVAWISERKNLLAGFFWMLTLLSYIYYAERPGFWRYCLILLSFALGLMSKPILVTMPFLFLVIDYWPLKRMGHLDRGDDKSGRPENAAGGNRLFSLLLEKIPFFFLSGASILVSSLVAQGHGTWVPARLVPFTLRIQNALVSYPAYLRKALWPSELAPFYPYPQEIPLWETIAAGFFLIGVTAVAFRQVRQRPYVLVGWLWFAGTLVPVLGLVQQGLWPRIADRFAYLPVIGLFLTFAWGLADLARIRWASRPVLVFLGCAAVLAFGIITRHENAYWRNSTVLFEHTLNVTKKNFPAHMNLGIALASEGRAKEAVIQFQHALKAGHPRPEQVHSNLGLAYASVGDKEKALQHYQAAVQVNPHDAEAYINLGLFWLHEKNFEESLAQSFRALEIKRESEKAHNTIGVAYLHQGNRKEAAKHFREALRIHPGYIAAEKNLEIALRSNGPQ